MSARDALSREERRGSPRGEDAASRVRLRAPEGAVSERVALCTGRPRAGKFPLVWDVWSDPEQSGAIGGPR